ncbi:MAG: DUF1848 domain-containing protein, partial [Desulfobacteraceae bacterium]|nr:DUF1848 domain-containing protein [Desulfobacteraceae bacterium]
MTPIQDKIISASRRTDIPGFYMDWFMKQILCGFFMIKNPYNQLVRKVEVRADTTLAIVFWSKNFNILIK